MSTGLTSTVWLTIFRAKHPVNSRELAHLLPNLTRNQRSTALRAAHLLGYVERTGFSGCYSYEVTPRCAIPAGIALRDVREATA